VNIDGVYAQALHLLKNGFKYYFDTTEIVEVNTRNEQFSIRTTEDELLEKLFTPATDAEIKAQVCVWKSGTEVAIRANAMHSYPLNRNSARDFGVALKKSGFRSKRVSKGVLYATVDMDGPVQLTASKNTSNQAPQLAGVIDLFRVD